MPKVKKFSQFEQLETLIELVNNSAEKMHVRPFEVFFTIAQVTRSLGITRHKAKAFLDSLVNAGILHKQGLRYRYNPENLLFMAMCDAARNY